jgi:ABC-2 type transport system ATP-binding protein
MIIAEKLVKDYGPFRAVDRVSFEVKPGDILGFLGPNGAGKSTTMKMITGFLPPSSGTARVGGYDIQDNPIQAKRLLGYLPESGPLYPEMTVWEFLSFSADLRGLKGSLRDKDLARVVAICHLEPVKHQTIETLSKGFRQRVGLAQAILHNPSCLILDEPTDGLDPNQKKEVRNLIASMASEKAIILSTHILEEVESMCNRVIIIAGGKLIADESPEALRQRHPNFNSVILELDEPIGDSVRSRVQSLDMVKSTELSENRLTVHPGTGGPLKPALWELATTEQWNVRTLEKCKVPLDEVFHQLTKTQIS